MNIEGEGTVDKVDDNPVVLGEGERVVPPNTRGVKVDGRVSVGVAAATGVPVGFKGDKVNAIGVREGEGTEVRVSPSVGPA